MFYIYIYIFFFTELHFQYSFFLCVPCFYQFHLLTVFSFSLSFFLAIIWHTIFNISFSIRKISKRTNMFTRIPPFDLARFYNSSHLEIVFYFSHSLLFSIPFKHIAFKLCMCACVRAVTVFVYKPLYLLLFNRL